MLMADLPTLITASGTYLTRDGRVVTIYDVNGTGTFAARGAIHKMFRGKIRPRGYNIWHVSGRFDSIHENARDLVAKVRP